MLRPYALFDMDGTLLDSMPYWSSLDRDYLTSQGIEMDAAMLEKTEQMRLLDALAWYHEVYGLGTSPEAMAAECQAIMIRHYEEDIALKPGALAYLEGLRREGVAMALVTASPPPIVEVALARTGIRDFFDVVLSIDDVGASKCEPVIYDVALRRLGGSHPGQAVVYEDATYALRTAHRAGYYTVRVEDPCYRASLAEARGYAHRLVGDLGRADLNAIHGLYIERLAIPVAARAQARIS